VANEDETRFLYFCFSRCLWAGKSSVACRLCAVLAFLIYKEVGKGCEQHRKAVYDMYPIHDVGAAVVVKTAMR